METEGPDMSMMAGGLGKQATGLGKRWDGVCLFGLVCWFGLVCLLVACFFCLFFVCVWFFLSLFLFFVDVFWRCLFVCVGSNFLLV